MGSLKIFILPMRCTLMKNITWEVLWAYMTAIFFLGSHCMSKFPSNCGKIQAISLPYKKSPLRYIVLLAYKQNTQGFNLEVIYHIHDFIYWIVKILWHTYAFSQATHLASLLSLWYLQLPMSHWCAPLHWDIKLTSRTNTFDHDYFGRWHSLRWPPPLYSRWIFL